MREEAMARAIGDRDEEALGLVMEKYAHLLWPIAAAVLKNVGSDQDVEECVADAFIYLWEHPGNFDPSRGKLKTLLCILTRSRAIDRYRDLNRRNTLPLEEALCGGGLCNQEALEEAETRAELRQLLQSLGEAAEEVEQAKNALGLEKEELEDTKAELDSTQETLEARQLEAEALLQELLAKGRELEGLWEEYEARGEEFMREIAAKQVEYDAAKQAEWEQYMATYVPPTTQAPQDTGNQGNTTTGGAAASNPGSSVWLVPCSYTMLTSPFGNRKAPLAGASTYHQGVDLAAPRGTPVRASRAGIVTVAGYSNSAGNYVQINHQDGFSSIYMHLDTYCVSAGQVVSGGQQLGTVGTTGISKGYHLHFGISYNGAYVNPCSYVNLS